MEGNSILRYAGRHEVAARAILLPDNENGGGAKSLQQRSDMALVIIDAEALLDDALEIDAPPAHDADLSVGACFDDCREFFPLRRRQTRCPPLRPIDQKPVGTSGVETANSVAQRLTINVRLPSATVQGVARQT